MKEKKIVVVDDDPIIREDVIDILQSSGYKVIGHAKDGFSAIKVCRELRPDIVIMDVDMPDLDGIKASKIIKKEDIAGGVVFLTGRDDDECFENAKNIGAFNYIIKPIDEKAFIRTVDMALSKVMEFNELKADLKSVNNKLNERKIIEKAKGILIKQLSISEDEAYKKIRNLGMEKRISMAEIAEVIVLSYEE